MLKIDAPIDPECGANTNEILIKEYEIPQLINDSRMQRRKRKAKFFMSTSIRENKKQENYFQKMFQQTKKKIYVSMFIRKLKQSISPRSSFEHHLCQQQNDKYYGAMKTLKCNINFQCLFLIVLIVVNWFACLTTTLQISFDQVRSSVRYFSIVFIIFGVSEIMYTIFIKSRIRVKKSKRNIDFVRESFGQYVQSGWIFIDSIILFIFILNMLIDETALSYLKLVILFKIKQANEKMKNLQIIFIQNNFKEQYWELIKVFIFNFLFAHFLAIILAILGNGPRSWVENYSFERNWLNVYIWAYYWATNIMLTVGFGDIAATNLEQALCLIFIQTLSCVVLAYNINSIGNIIQKITSYEEEKSANLKIFTHMQNEEGISEDAKIKITDFITQSAELKKKFNVTQEQQFLKKLPRTFYEQYKVESTQKIFLNLPFFRNLGNRKLQELAIKVEKKLAHPEEVLIQKNTIPKILIINNGKLSLHMKSPGNKSDGREIQIIKADQRQFRLVSQYFIINKPINYQIKCKDYSIIYSMTTKQLKQVLSTNPYSYEYYCMSRDRDRFNPNDLEAQLCSLCSNKSHKSFHTLFDCPQLHFLPLKNLIIEKALKHNPQKIQIHQHCRINTRKNMNPLLIYAELEDMFNNNEMYRESTKNLLKSYGKLESLDINDDQIMMDDSLMQELANIKAKFLIELTKKNTQEDQSVKIYCERIGCQIGQHIREEFKNMCFPTSKQTEFEWDIDADAAHDYAFYFQKQNPEKLADKYRKRNLGRKMKNSHDKDK